MNHDFILLDRSGSMGNRWTEALSSINAYVDQLAKDNVDTGVTLVTFDQFPQTIAFDVIRDRIIPKTWKRVTNEDCMPRGGTPLNDAIGRLVNLAKFGNYDKVALIIMTDGEENASKELTHHAAKSLLQTCRDKGWQVIMLGADFNNVKQAESYGMQFGQHVSSTSANLVGTMRMTAGKRFDYGATGQSMNYTDDEKKKAAE